MMVVPHPAVPAPSPDVIRSKILERETTVYCSAFSPDGEYLVCACSFGRISVWKISLFLNVKNWDKLKTSFTPQFSFQAHKGPIYSLIFAESVLVSGGDEEVRVWRWSEFLEYMKGSQGKLAPIHEFKSVQNIFTRGSLSMYAETNGLAYDNKRQYILGACGDILGYIWDLQQCKLVSTLQGHTNYLHAICAMPNSGQACTASEDGTIRVWDITTSKSIGTLPVSGGKWVAALAMDRSETWLTCGGGSKELVQYYLPNMTKSWSVATTGYVQALSFVDNKIVCVGNEKYIYHYTFSGELTRKVGTSLSSVFSATINQNSLKNQVLVVTGSSPKIDVYIPDYASITVSLDF